jgi:phenylacetate-coenzyme A ligase PaaK-like adenylate-forming protein
MSVDTDLTPEMRQAQEHAAEQLDAHVREIINWHFSPETGTPFWLDWAKKNDFDPIAEVTAFADITKFPHFQDEWLRDELNERWVPKAYEGRPYFIFETGGTTGMPKQRIGWEDHKVDYEEFGDALDEEFFPRGANWLMLGPTGPRRLRLAIEHLAHYRGGVCYHVDLDPRWVKRLIADKDAATANKYKDHVVEQGATILKNRKVTCLFTTPLLLEALDSKLNVPDAGIKGVFCGGTQMNPQTVRFLVEEVLENRAQFIPTYGNTLMGLACSRPINPEDNWSITYHAPQPRAVLRVVDPNDTARTVDYGTWGRVELTTLTKELFMPRFLERDEAIRRGPWGRFPWDGVGEVRPFGAMEKQTIEGVY